MKSSIDPWDISILFAKLFFVFYIILLYATGQFVDWQELIVEPFFILRGLKLYTDIGTHHTPLLTEFLAAIYRFVGTDIIVRKLLLVLISVSTAFLTYRATHRLAGKRAGLLSILLFTIFWPFYGGTEFWFDTFLPLFYLFSFVLIIERHSPKWLAIAGISMGLSFLIKQNSALVAASIFLMLLLRSKPIRTNIKDALVFSAGVLAPIVIIASWYASRGQLGDTYYWTIKYNLSGYYQKFAIKPPPINELLRLFVIIAPIMVLLIGTILSKIKRRMISWEFRLAFYMGFCASFAILPRWERFHVAPAIPFLVIILVLSFKMFLTKTDAISGIQRKKMAKIIFFLWICVILLDIGMLYPPMLIDNIIPHFSRHWPLRSYDVPAWYDESYRRYVYDLPLVGRYLRDETTEGEKIFVWGWLGSQIYFESGRLPAGKFYYALPWLTCLPRFRRDLLMGFERDRPRYVIVARKRHQYPGTPSLNELGIDLDKRGYIRLQKLKDRFPEVEVWKFSKF